MGKYSIDTHVSVLEFVKKLDNSSKARIDRFYDLFEEYGPYLPRSYFKKIAANIWELRLGNVRLLLTMQGNKAFVIHGFKKNSQKIHPKDLKLAIKRAKGII